MSQEDADPASPWDARRPLQAHRWAAHKHGWWSVGGHGQPVQTGWQGPRLGVTVLLREPCRPAPWSAGGEHDAARVLGWKVYAKDLFEVARADCFRLARRRRGDEAEKILQERAVSADELDLGHFEIDA